MNTLPLLLKKWLILLLIFYMLYKRKTPFFLLNEKKKLNISFPEKASALNGDENGPWPAKRRRNSIYKNMGLLCCVSRPNYL